jgi:hypothetical protein
MSALKSILVMVLGILLLQGSVLAADAEKDSKAAIDACHSSLQPKMDEYMQQHSRGPAEIDFPPGEVRTVSETERGVKGKAWVSSGGRRYGLLDYQCVVNVETGAIVSIDWHWD